MRLLFHPHIGIGEGPTGYLRRLADANRVSLIDLEKLGIRFDLDVLRDLKCLPPANQNAELDRYVELLALGLSDPKVAWVDRVGRYCPVCLAENPRWRIGWELQFCDACPDHNVWLIDTCACGCVVHWGRRNFAKCDCGRSFANERPSECPKVVGQLSALLNAKLHGQESSCDFQVSRSLALPQFQRLIRFLGTYGDTQPGSRPQKIAFQDRLSVSWPITSLAAEILANWPNSLYQVLDRLQRERAVEGGGRLGGRFGFLYTALYKAFPGSEFASLRVAFENYLAENWRGAMGERNRRLPPKFLDRAAWIPGNHACQKLGISTARLSKLIAENRIAGESRTGPSGRAFLVVRREDVDREVQALASEVDLITAARILGVTKRRMRELRPTLFPEATKSTDGATPWVIPRQWLDTLMRIVETAKLATKGADESAKSVSMGHVFRYWAWSDKAVAEALKAIGVKDLMPVGALDGVKGAASLLFRDEDLREWHERTQRPTDRPLTIPEVAKSLGIKQEVAYSLIRSGFLPTVSFTSGKNRVNQGVSANALRIFGENYLFARDMVGTLARSSRKIIQQLAALGINPVSGPTVDGCRQVLYANNVGLSHAMMTLRVCIPRRR